MMSEALAGFGLPHDSPTLFENFTANLEAQGGSLEAFRQRVDLKEETKSGEAGCDPQPILSLDDAEQHPHPQTEWRSTLEVLLGLLARGVRLDRLRLARA
jgi:hypothetical protein